MAVHRFAEVVQTLRRTTIPDESRVSDSQLLTHFIERQDEIAFAALVKRHSSMVWGVCRRIVPHHQDAEDAFQATFLVLARKAYSVRPRHMLANWLFGVAQRTALKAKTMATKRRVHEKQISEMPDVAAVEPVAWVNLETLFDQELAKLPDKYRSAIVLCDLEGKKGKDAAQQMKIPEGTLASRLRTGRVLLAKRLARRGVTLSGGALANALAQNAASASTPIGLVGATVKVALLSAAGKHAVGGVISANVLDLMEGTMKFFLVTKLKTVLALALVFGSVALGGGLFCRHVAAEQESSSNSTENSVNQPKIADEAVVPSAVRKKTRATPSAGDKPQPVDERCHQVVYPVLDLVMPVELWDTDANDKKATQNARVDWLIRKIKESVAPSSWNEHGGAGTIDFNPHGRSLVVTNTFTIHTLVKGLLETMRRFSAVGIAVELRAIRLDVASFRKLKETLRQTGDVKFGLRELDKEDYAVWSEDETLRFLRSVKDDSHDSMTIAPRLNLLSGQRTKMTILENDEEHGLVFGLKAIVAADLQRIELDVKGRVDKTEFAKSLPIQDGCTFAQCRSAGETYVMVLVTPHVVIETDGPMAPPLNANPAGAR
jgi:RNA polymerase sigma factor (sigma-70 family)